MKKPGTCGTGQNLAECDAQRLCGSSVSSHLGISGPKLVTSTSKRLYRTSVRIACLMSILIGPLSAQQRVTNVQPAASVNSDPPDPTLVQVPEDPHLPRVLIMGDSISMGYTGGGFPSRTAAFDSQGCSTPGIARTALRTRWLYTQHAAA